MIVELTNRLFGWHWVQIFAPVIGNKVCRVRTAVNGDKYIKVWGEYWFLSPDGSVVGQGCKYTPLTWAIGGNDKEAALAQEGGH